MPAHSLDRFVGWLRGLSAGRPEGTDSDLLRAYTAGRDESAFTELIRRHGGLVWGVCRRSLAREQDAEDAFQATFLVLSRKAESIRAGQSLPSWLFGVARRSALFIRERANRPIPEREPIRAPDPADEASSAETCAIILDEVRRLPENYRLPLLLCGLEGLTKAEAARRLGWKEGTVSGRLGRARQRLRQRLERRGLLAMAGTIPTFVAAVPGHLLATTVHAARQWADSHNSVSPIPFPAILAQEVIRSMRKTIRSFLVPLVLGGLIVLATTGAIYYKTVTAAVPVAAEPPQADPTAPRWQERLRLRGYLGGAYCAFTPDGRLMATIDGRHVLRFLDTKTWQERVRCELTKYPNGSYYHPIGGAFTADGKLFVIWWHVPGKDKGAKPLQETWLIEVATGKVRHTVAGSHPQFIPASNLLALRRDNDLVFWDYVAGAEVRTLAGMPVKWQKWFSPDGKFLYVPTAQGNGKLWETTSGKEIATLDGFNAVWSKDGKSLATVMSGPMVKLWDLPTGKLRATLQGFSQPGCQVEFSPDGRLLLTSVSEFGLKPDGDIDWPKRGQPYRPKRNPLDVRLWEAATGRELLRLPGEIYHCRSGLFSPDGKTIAYLRFTDEPGYLMEAVLWDVAASKERLVLRTKDGLDGLLFSPDGTVLFSQSGPHGRSTMRLWDVATGRPLPSVPGTRELASHPMMTFSPDNKILTLSFIVPGGVVGKPALEELQVYQWSAAPVTAETRGEPIVLEPKQEEPSKPSSAAEKTYDELKQKNETATKVFSEKLADAKSKDDRLAVERERIAVLEGFTSRALEIARKNPRDPVAIDSLEFALRMTGGMGGKLGELGRSTIDQVRRDHLKSPALDRLLPWLATHCSEAADEVLRTTFEQSPHRTVRGRAGYHLARSLVDQADVVRLLRQLPKLADHPHLKDRADFLASLRSSDPEAMTHQAEALYERLRKDYADVTQNDFRPVPLGEIAERGLFVLHNLAVGKTAPDIEGADLDGRKFRLSDYRGQVVLLVFCGWWCGPCQAMNPHKQALLRRYEGKPVAVLEVNSDPDPGEWKRIMKQKGYTWRCWADGEDGPIAKKWNVSRWPTIYVLDADGTIRYKDLPTETFEQVLDALLGETKAK